MTMNKLVVFIMVFLIILLPAANVLAQPAPILEININGEEGTDWVFGLQLLFLLTVLSLAPSIIIMMTSFTRIVVVLSLLRSALATQRMPPNQVLIGLALFLTVFIMAPVFQEINEVALQPYIQEEIGEEEAFNRGLKPIRDFMFRYTRERDLALFVQLSGADRPGGPDDVETHLLIPAFIISELARAFQIGFLIYIPFIVIDMIVASTLMSMGMLMLPPVMISLPFKILLFVLVDGWYLVIKSLVATFG